MLLLIVSKAQTEEIANHSNIEIGYQAVSLNSTKAITSFATSNIICNYLAMYFFLGSTNYSHDHYHVKLMC